MPIAVACSCGVKLQAPDSAAGKGVTCPKCAAVVKVPATAEKAAALARPTAPVKAAVPGKSAPGKPAAAVKAAAPKPAAKPAGDDDNDLDMLEEVNEKELPDGPSRKVVACEIPDYARERLSGELTSGEKVVWVGQASPKVACIRSLWAVLFGVFIFLIFGCVVGTLMSTQFKDARSGRDMTPLLVMGIIGLVVLISCLCSFLMPVYKVWAARRSCYVVTNRRCMVWYGGFSAKEDYLPGALSGMRRNNAWFCGSDTGDLVFRSVTRITHRVDNRGRVSRSRSTTYYGFLSVQNLTEVERIVRETLVDRWQRKIHKLASLDDDDE